MIDESRSTLSFRSNLQPIIEESNVSRWEAVYPAVRDPFALEVMKNRGATLTAAQMRQYQYASVHCAYAYHDDYPWGSIINADGKEVVKCRCLNTKCLLFTDCRPDFDEAELSIFEDNKMFSWQALEFSRKSEINTILEIASEFVPVHVPEEVVETPEPEVVDEKPRITENGSTSEEKKPDKKIVDKARDIFQELSKKPVIERTEPVDFSSFVVADQSILIYADIKERVLVNAGPGTGKTWTLIEKIKCFLDREDADSEGIMILCFSRAAVEVIEQRLQDAVSAGEISYENATLDIRTFDSFCTYVISWAMEVCREMLPRNYSIEGQDYDARIIMTTELLKKKQDILSLYNHLIVDEVQDLVGCRAELVLQMLRILPDECGFTLLGDACQALYDWQANDNPNMMSSEKFYNQVFKEYPDIQYWTFLENHRQSGALSEIAVPYREAILTGTPESRSRIVTQIFANVQNSSINLQRISKAEIEKFRTGGTLGILTRTNGQALKISELLRNADISHSVQKPSSDANLQPWIANTLIPYQNETINESMFVSAFLSGNPGLNTDNAREAWNALISTQFGDCKTRFEVSELLRGLLRNGRNKALFVTNNPNAQITVSNIHRAKGREYDAVLVLDDVLNPQNGAVDDVQEHKVRYVALTRPRRKLSDVTMKPQYIYIDSGSRRCFQASFSKNRNRYLTHIEIGLSGDIDNKSFASSAERQSYIINYLEPGTRLKLLKLPQDGPVIQYKIVLEENENVCLGTTGASFYYGLKRAMQRIWECSSNIDYKYYANIFSDIYVDDIITCVATSEPKMKGAKVFENMAVFKGFSVSGFARYEKDLY